MPFYIPYSYYDPFVQFAHLAHFLPKCMSVYHIYQCLIVTMYGINTCLLPKWRKFRHLRYLCSLSTRTRVILFFNLSATQGYLQYSYNIIYILQIYVEGIGPIIIYKRQMFILFVKEAYSF